MKISIPAIAAAILFLATGCDVFTPGLSALPDSLSPGGTIHYVRMDGGDAQQCSGLADQPYPGSGQNQPCAWDHPARALPPGGPPRITGGDTLIIAHGNYRLGVGGPGASSPALCNHDNPWDCNLSPVPAGPDAQHPTLILGEGWDDGCKTPPELWGVERVQHLFDLTRTSNAVIACLELTDHAACADGHPDGKLSCQRSSYPYGEWGSVGIYAEDADNILLRNLNIHGMAVAGIHAGRLRNWRLEDTRLAGNGLVGWDGDLWQGSDANSGTLEFSNVVIEWNGCVETYPGEKPVGCWAQPAGGYGDGLGTGVTGGHWIFENTSFLHNTSDGLDLLYATNDARIEIRRSRAEGNGGNQIKTSGPLEIENTIINGNCAFFGGQAFTASGDYNGDGKIESGVENCRANGNTLSIALWRGDRAMVTNNSLIGQGDCLVIAHCAKNGMCGGDEQVVMENNLFIGYTDFTEPTEKSCLVYNDDLPKDPFSIDYALIYNVKEDVCLGSHSLCGVDPGVISLDLFDFNPRPLENSPLLDAARQLKCPKDDFTGRPRPQGSGCEIGAIEYSVDDLFYFPFVGN